MRDGGDGEILRKLTNSREPKRIEAVMVEPEVKSDLMAPFASEVKPAAMRVLDKKNSVKSNHSLLQPPQLLHPPTHHVGAFLHLGSQTMLGSDHHAEMIAALEAQLQRTQEELISVKEQLAVSETGKAQAHREYTNIKNLLDQISLVEHFAASDDVEVETAPLPLNWSDGSSAAQLDTDAHLKEIENLRSELEAEKSLNSKFAAELEKAKHEMDGVHHKSEISRKESSRLQSELEAGRNRQGSLSLEVEDAKKDILSLQATLSDAWSHQGTSALELARAKEEIAWLEADLKAARNLTLDLARAKENIASLQGDLELAHRLQETTSTELSEAHDEISRLSSGTTHAILTNTALEVELEDLRGLQETSTTELQNAKQEILELHREHETRIAERDSESANTKEEIRRLQGELTAALTDARGSAIMLKVAEEEMEELQKKLGVMRGQYYNTSAELSEATEQNEKLRSEKETLQLKYESCSSELFNVKEDVFRLEVEHLASHEDLMTDITNAQEENLRLQAEVDTLKDEKITLSVDLAKGRDEIKSLQSELETVTKRHYSACNDLFTARKEISRLQGELSDCCREIDSLRGICRSFQMELIQVQELHDVVMAELVNAKKKLEELQLGSTQEFERSLEVVRGLKDEMCKVQGELSMQYSSLISEKSLTEKQMRELGDTNVQLQEAVAAQKKAENALAESIKETETLNAELEQVRCELAKAREAESKLQSMAMELEELRSQSMSTALASELSALNTELCAMKNSEANYQEIVSSSQAQIEELKTRLYALRDSEAKANERLVSTSSELQKVKIEHAIAKEALEWVGGDAAALSAELEAKNAELEATKDVLEAKRAEVASTKEGESRAKVAFTDYSLKLQRMKSELEDATKLADKARAFKLDLDEAIAKLEEATESEKTMSSSMASLKAELNNAKTELEAAREDHGIALAEKQQQYELELNQMRSQWEVAVMAEAEEASFAVREATQEAEKAKEEVEDLHAHMETLELKLETLHLEVEAAKASEEWAFAQMRLKTIPEYDMETDEEGPEAPASFEEYQNLKMKAKELQELVNKRVAVGVAEVNAAKASEKETHRRLQTLEKELQSLRTELTEAINKREEAEAAKYSCEAALHSKRLNHNKSLSHSGHLNGAHPSGKLMNPGDRQGSLNGICFEDSLESSSSPSRSSFSFASFASPGRSEKSPMESVVVLAPSEESSKQRKLKFSSKIGDYFRKKKVPV